MYYVFEEINDMVQIYGKINENCFEVKIIQNAKNISFCRTLDEKIF